MTLHAVSEAGVRHTFLSSPNPRTTSCARCGKSAGDTVHAFLDVGLQAAVRAHLGMAVNAARAGDMDEVIRQAGTAVRLAQEGI